MKTKIEKIFWSILALVFAITFCYNGANVTVYLKNAPTEIVISNLVNVILAYVSTLAGIIICYKKVN